MNRRIGRLVCQTRGHHNWQKVPERECTFTDRKGRRRTIKTGWSPKLTQVLECTTCGGSMVTGKGQV